MLDINSYFHISYVHLIYQHIELNVSIWTQSRPFENKTQFHLISGAILNFGGHFDFFSGLKWSKF